MILPPLACSELTVRRLMSPAGTFTSNVRLAAHVDAVGAGDAHGERGQPDLAGLELEGLALALAGA